MSRSKEQGSYIPIDDWHKKYFPGLKREFKLNLDMMVGNSADDHYSCIRIMMIMLRENVENKGKVTLKEF